MFRTSDELHRALIHRQARRRCLPVYWTSYRPRADAQKASIRLNRPNSAPNWAPSLRQNRIRRRTHCSPDATPPARAILNQEPRTRSVLSPVMPRPSSSELSLPPSDFLLMPYARTAFPIFMGTTVFCLLPFITFFTVDAKWCRIHVLLHNGREDDEPGTAQRKRCSLPSSGPGGRRNLRRSEIRFPAGPEESSEGAEDGCR